MIKHGLGQKVVPLHAPRGTFLEDAVDWFEGRKFGHMAKWLFSSPQYEGDPACGANVWEKVINQAKEGSPYYVFKDEQSIISSSLSVLSRHFSRPLTLVDLGPGSKDAIESKTCPVISELNGLVKQYISIDTNQEFLNSSSEIISTFFPKIAYGELCLDFLEDSFRYPSKENLTVALLFGVTLCNMLIDPRESRLSLLLLESYFRRLRSHFGNTSGYLVITQDTNRNGEKLISAYRAISDYFKPLLYRIKRDLGVFGDYEPENFDVDFKFFSETGALSVLFIPRKSMSFTINGRFIKLKVGTPLFMGNTFKFDKETFLNIARAADFLPVETVEQDGNPCILHILRAA